METITISSSDIFFHIFLFLLSFGTSIIHMFDSLKLSPSSLELHYLFFSFFPLFFSMWMISIVVSSSLFFLLLVPKLLFSSYSKIFISHIIIFTSGSPLFYSFYFFLYYFCFLLNIWTYLFSYFQFLICSFYHICYFWLGVICSSFSFV